MISFESNGSYKDTENFLKNLGNPDVYSQLSRYGDIGVRALRDATPQDTGETADSWTYEIVKDRTSWSIIWSNTHMAGDTPVAVLIQMGHGTRNGGYVEGVDFINPALKSIFDQMAAEGWKVVTQR